MVLYTLRLVIDNSRSVDGEWIVTKKDWQEAEKRHKAHEKQRSSSGKNSRKSESTPVTPPPGLAEETAAPNEPDMNEMDEMRCILYTHGGKSTTYLTLSQKLTYLYRRLLFWQCGSGEIRDSAIRA